MTGSRSEAVIANPLGGWQLAAWWTMAICLTVLLAVHFSLVQVANLPTNPLRAEYRNQVEYWVHPLFTQNWSFFAPEPSSEDVDLLARGEYTDSSGRKRVSQWLNVSTPLIDAVRRNRFSALFLVEVTLSNTLNVYNNNTGRDNRATIVRKGQRYFKPVMSAAIDPYDENMLARFASSALEVAYPNVRSTRIQIAVLHHRFPRFNSRFDGRKDVWFAQRVDWQPFVPVATFCCTG